MDNSPGNTALAGLRRLGLAQIRGVEVPLFQILA